MIDFLMNVWKQQCSEGDYVCLSEKSSSGWKDKAIKFDGDLQSNLQSWFESQNDGTDLYFCPLAFSGSKRKKELAKPSVFAWADIDEADPHLVEPTILWQSSPGRHQGLWKLPRRVSANEAAAKSKDLAYYAGFDRGGWDVTQVLRIPGSRNHKYPTAPQVKLIHDDGPLLKSVPKRVIDKWRKTIPRKLLSLIEGPATMGKRSDTLWFLEHELCDLGIPLPDVIEILRESDWNKYRGREDENERFAAEIEKIAGDREEKQVKTRVESVILRVDSYMDLMTSQDAEPGWMVENWWLRNSHGIVAGEPKSFKSTLVMDMLFSVATGAPFFGSEVKFGGPVLIIQNENADWILKDRLAKISHSKGMGNSIRRGRNGKLSIEWARDAPIHFINQQSFTLDDAGMLDALEDLIRQLRPAAINLDPLYLMFGGDVNSAKDLNPVLTWCLRIKQEYGCSVILVHHYNKGSAGQRGGQRMLGSTTLHGWIESAWYIQAQDPVDGRALVTMDREFRGSGLHAKVDVALDIGDAGDSKYDVQVLAHGSAGGGDAGDDICSALEQTNDSMNVKEISKAIGLSMHATERLVKQLVEAGRVARNGARYVLA